jgi:hypothetical protein
MKQIILPVAFLLSVTSLFAQWSTNGSNTYSTNSSNNIGIGTGNSVTSPFKLEVVGSGQLIRNTTSTGYTTLRLYNNLNSAMNALEIDYAGSGFGSSTLLSGGITGEAGSIATNGAFPLMFGTSNVARMTILANGSIGIGTNNPNYKLEVAGNVVNSTPSNGYIGLTGDLPGYSNNVYPTLKTSYTNLYFSANGKYSAYIGGTDAVFGLNDAAATAKVLLNSNGNSYLNGGKLGIGIATPLEKLHVEGNIYIGTNQMQFLSSNGGNNRIHSATTGSWTFKSRFDDMVLDAGESAGNERKIFFRTAGSDRMMINSDGNVGLGTITPQEKLHVEGNVYIGTNQMQFLSSNGGNNRIHSATTGSWTFKSRFDDMVLDAGESAGNERKIFFKTAGSDRMIINSDGNIGIGTTSPDQKLTVKGIVHTQEVRVDLTGAVTPDYVFEPDYNLTSLSEIETYVKENKHLPEVPSAKQMEEEGLNLKEMNLLLLKKVEELTLYVIDLKNENIEQQKKLSNQQQQIDTILKKN